MFIFLKQEIGFECPAWKIMSHSCPTGSCGNMFVFANVIAKFVIVHSAFLFRICDLMIADNEKVDTFLPRIM